MDDRSADKENGQNGRGPSPVVRENQSAILPILPPREGKMVAAATGKSTNNVAEDGRADANVRGRDPPGAYSGGNAALVGSHPWLPPGASGGVGHPYGGGGPQYPPVFPSMHQWGGYHAAPPGHHREPSAANSDRTWNVPTFLRHPFAAFMAASHGGHGCSPPWASSSGGNDGPGRGDHPFLPPVPPAADDRDGREETSASSGEDEPMEENAPAREGKTKTAFIPSMFAPQEAVDKIRERNQRSAAARTAVAIDGAPRSQPSGSRSKKTHLRVRPSKKKGAHQVSELLSYVRRGEELIEILLPRAPFFRAPQNHLLTRLSCQAMSPPSRQARASATDSEALRVITVCGKRVTMIDDARKVFVIDLLSSEECDEIRTMTDSHVRDIIKSGSDEETWRTLYTYTKMDLPIVEVKDLGKRYTDQILHDVKKIVAELFGRKDAMKLRPRSWKEPHLLLYQRLEDRPPHSGIEMHYDGCDITCELFFESCHYFLSSATLINNTNQTGQAMLTRLDEYEGGGTYFRSLRKT